MTPALIAAGGGSLLMGGILAHERRREKLMRASRVRLGLRFPAGVDQSRAQAALDGLSGLPFTTELVCEVAAGGGAIGHALWVPAALRASVCATLAGVIPGLRISEADGVVDEPVTLALGLVVTTPVLLGSEYVVESARALLSGLSLLGDDEQVVIRWALRPGAPKPAEGEPVDQRAREVDRAWRRKLAGGGFSAAGLVLIRAATAGRARMLAGHIESVLRSRRGLAGEIRTGRRGRLRLSSLPRTRRSSGFLSTAELGALVAWPVGSEVVAGIEVGAARELLVARQVPRQGRRLLMGRDVRGERPVALSAEAISHHLAVVGPSGSGKSTLLTTGVLSDIAAGYGGVVFDPKGPDLIETILDRVPAEHADRVVVVDPAEAVVPGVALLSGGDPDLRAELLTGALRAIFAGAWGVRTDHYLRLAIRTLAATDGATLADVGRLFFDESFRGRALAGIGDPYLRSAWQDYARLSEAARVEHVEAPLRRVMALLTRPAVRAVLASPEPKLDIGRLLAQRKWLLVSLSPGQIGESAASLLATALLYVVWSAIEARSKLPAQRRHLLALYIDELASLAASLPFSFELLAERARGLGAGLTVAMQTLGRVPEPARSALLGNCASFITFRAGAEEAARIQRQLPGLSESDVIALGRFEVAARIGTGLGSAVSVLTGHTLPLPAPTGQAAMIRAASAARYGTPIQATVEATKAAELPGAGERPGRTGRAS